MKNCLFLAFALIIFPNSKIVAQSLNDRTIFVRFNTGTTVSEKNGAVTVDGNPFSIAAGKWRKAYSRNGESLDSLRAIAAKRLNKSLPDLNLDYRFTVTNASDLESAIEQLNENSFVFSAKKAPQLYNASAPDFQNFQGYLKNAAEGINAEEVWSVYNNHGEGIKICDLEYGFNPTHIDLPAVTLVGPEPQDPFGGSGGDHGTAVLGEMAGLNDGVGITGIAYGSQYYFAGTYYDDEYNLEEALIETIFSLQEGDIVLIEQQISGPLSGENQFGLVPVEWVREFYDAIQIVIGQGIIVVEAAGNGRQNLDDEVYQQDNFDHYPFMPGNGSGAIIVGAGSTGTSDNVRSAMWYTNSGSAVEIQGNGESIYTTGYGDLFNDSDNEMYTSDFGGTSGASPIVTGAIALLTSTYFQETGLSLTRNEIVEVLNLTGQQQQDGDFEVSDAHIGALPDVKAALNYLLTDFTSLDENSTSSVKVYPNPATEQLVVTCVSEKIAGISDITGNSIPFLARASPGGFTQVDIQNFPRGVYFINVADDEKSEIVKVVIN